MSNLFLTLIIAFVVIVLAIAALAIGWLITGRTRIERSCGRDPTQKKEDSCGTKRTCDLCEHPEEKKVPPTHEDSSIEEESTNAKP